ARTARAATKAPGGLMNATRSLRISLCFAATYVVCAGGCSGLAPAEEETATVATEGIKTAIGDLTEETTPGGGIVISLPPASYDTEACCTFSSSSTTWSQTVTGCYKETAGSCCYDKAIGWFWSWQVLGATPGTCGSAPKPNPTPNCKSYLCSRGTQFGGLA